MRHLGKSIILFALVALSGLVIVPSAVFARAAAQTVTYTKGWYEPNNPSAASRQMLYVNNPEQLQLAEMANYTPVWQSGRGPAIYSVQLAANSRYRAFFEHSNATGGAIGYGLFFFNNSGVATTITVRGKGFVQGFSASTGQGGGVAFRDVFNNYNGTNFQQISLAAGAGTWIRWDNLGGANFSGVVDFDTSAGGPLLRFVAYRGAFSGLPGSYYSTGYEDRGIEERVYKGVSEHTAVTTNLSYTIDSTDVNQPLLVNYTGYQGSFTNRTNWVTSLDRDNDLGQTNGVGPAIGSDMVTFNYNDAGESWVFGPTSPDLSGKTANLGNWGVVYRTNVTITNRDAVARTIALRIQAPPATPDGVPHYVQFAHFSSATGNWQSRNLTLGSAPFEYVTKSIPANSSATINGFFVIGAPSYAQLRQSAIIR